MNSTQLTLEAEKAIRSYLFRLMIPVSGALTALGFLLGFGIAKYSDIVDESTRISAAKEASRQIAYTTQKANDAVVAVSQALYDKQVEFTEKLAPKRAEAQSVLDRITMLANEAEKLDQKVKLLRSIDTADEVIIGVTRSLLSDDAFISSVATQSSSELKNLGKQISDTSKALASYREEVGENYYSKKNYPALARFKPADDNFIELNGKGLVAWDFRSNGQYYLNAEDGSDGGYCRTKDGETRCLYP